MHRVLSLLVLSDFSAQGFLASMDWINSVIELELMLVPGGVKLYVLAVEATLTFLLSLLFSWPTSCTDAATSCTRLIAAS